LKEQFRLAWCKNSRIWSAISKTF